MVSASPLRVDVGIIFYFSVIVPSRFFRVVMVKYFFSFCPVASKGAINQTLTPTL